MPIDLEYLLSSSNQSFFHYTPFDTTDYSDALYEHSLPFSQNHCSSKSHIRHRDLYQKKTGNACFTSSNSYGLTDKSDTSREQYGVRKKKVSFADDRGLKLVEVREIPDAPKWADEVLTLLIGNTRRTVVKEKKWKAAFEHPPWPDDKLVETLESNMVALEHVSVKEGADDFLVGTIKVKNLAFEKNVFLRVTFDRWLTYVDIPCTYLESNKESTTPSKYDTFSFRTKISSVASRYEVIEFCVCYQCGGKDYWDNNSGINYRLITEYVRSSVPDLHQTSVPATFSSKSFSDTTTHNEMFMCNRMMSGNPCW